MNEWICLTRVAPNCADVWWKKWNTVTTGQFNIPGKCNSKLRMDHHKCYLNDSMSLLPDTQKCEKCMLRECRERFPHHRLQRKPLVSDFSMHHGTCVTHVPWCMSGHYVPSISGACTTRNFMYLAIGPSNAVHVLWKKGIIIWILGLLYLARVSLNGGNGWWKAHSSMTSAN